MSANGPDDTEVIFGLSWEEIGVRRNASDVGCIPD